MSPKPKPSETRPVMPSPPDPDPVAPAAPSSDRTSDGAKRMALLAVLVVAGAAVYANSFRGAFIFDDYASIHQNTLIHDLSTAWETPKTTTYTVAGRPVLSFTLGLSYAAGKLDPVGYHALNLAIHLLNHERTPEAAYESQVEHLRDHFNWDDKFSFQIMRAAVQNGVVTRAGSQLALTDYGRSLARRAMMQ